MRKRPGFFAIIMALAASIALIGATPSSASAVRHGISYPCGWRQTPPSTYDHVIWLWFENTSYNELVGNAQASAFNRLSRACGTASAYYGLTHPSWRNYIAATSGLGWQDAPPSCDPDPNSCAVPFPSLFDQIQSQGKQWRVYSEAMPSNCDLTNSDPYQVHHNPAPYYPAIADTCAKWNVPAGTPRSGALSTDLARNQLSAFSFLIPDSDNDMAGTKIPTGDKWLAGWMARILTSRAYLSGRTAVIVSFDEGDGVDAGEVCATTLDETCHIPTLMITPTTSPGTKPDTYFDHYSLLRTSEEMLGINDFLQLAGGTPADGVEALALPLPITVICELLGVPLEDQERFRGWSDLLLAMPGPGHDAEDVRNSGKHLAGYLDELIDRKRAEPGADLMTALLAAHDEGDQLDAEELRTFGMTLLVAGYHTTTSSIAHALFHLLHRPERYDELRRRPELLPTAVEELLRYSQVASGFGALRIATEDVEIGGCPVPAGAPVIPIFGSANRDADVFGHADEIDLAREDNPHLAFGAGIHYCLGAPLARAELQILFGTLTARVPSLALAMEPEEVPWETRTAFPRPSAIPVRW